MAQQASTIKHTVRKGSPGSGSKEGGPTDVESNSYTKRSAMYCGTGDSRPDSDNPRQSAR